MRNILMLTKKTLLAYLGICTVAAAYLIIRNHADGAYWGGLIYFGYPAVCAFMVYVALSQKMRGAWGKLQHVVTYILLAPLGLILLLSPVFIFMGFTGFPSDGPDMGSFALGVLIVSALVIITYPLVAMLTTNHYNKQRRDTW